MSNRTKLMIHEYYNAGFTICAIAKALDITEYEVIFELGLGRRK